MTHDALHAHPTIVLLSEESVQHALTGILLLLRQHVLTVAMELFQDPKSVKLQLSAALLTHDVSPDALLVQMDTLQIKIKSANTVEMDRFNLQKKPAIQMEIQNATQDARHA